MENIAILQQKQLLRVEEAARVLNVSRWTVYRWVDAGRLGGTRIGTGSLRIFSDTVASLIEHHCVGLSVVGVSGKEARVIQELPVRTSRRVRSPEATRPQAAL